ncbi:MAG: hypothetical protein RLZ51_2473, partial [Pseudomonadota bacterium]
MLHCGKLAPMTGSQAAEFSAYVTFSRDEWAAL